MIEKRMQSFNYTLLEFYISQKKIERAGTYNEYSLHFSTEVENILCFTFKECGLSF